MIVIGELIYNPEDLLIASSGGEDSIAIGKLPPGAQIISFEVGKVQYICDDGEAPTCLDIKILDKVSTQ